MKISKINKNWLLVGLLAVMLTVAGWQYGQVRQQIQLQATSQRMRWPYGKMGMRS